MQKIGILEYLPHKNTPQLIFNIERLNPADISLSKTFYSQRKKEAFAMLDNIIHYATSDNECRSRMLVSYFGEKKSENCEVCDVCLKRRRSEINEKKAKEIEANILAFISLVPKTITEIVTNLSVYKEKDVLFITRWLIEEGRVQSEGDMIRKC